MKVNKPLLLPNQNPKSSSVYSGYLILNMLKKSERISIFDLYEVLKGKDRSINYTNTIYALIFLHMSGLVDFNEPYVDRIK
jgi:hypothetical protein